MSNARKAYFERALAPPRDYKLIVTVLALWAIGVVGIVLFCRWLAERVNL